MDLLACLGEGATVDRFRIRPQAAPPGSPKEFTRFHVHSLGLSTGDHGEEEGDKLREGEFSVSGKVLGGLLLCGVDLSGNNFKKSFRVLVNLA